MRKSGFVAWRRTPDSVHGAYGPQDGGRAHLHRAAHDGQARCLAYGARQRIRTSHTLSLSSGLSLSLLTRTFAACNYQNID